MNISNNAKRIYNIYLYVTRTSQNSPFSARKDFETLSDEQQIALVKVETLLTKYPHIIAKDYFEAPYKIHPDQQFFSLAYFATHQAITDFTIYKKRERDLPPDDDKQIEKIKESLKFIAHFCMEKKIPLEQYISYKTGITYDWMKHLKYHQISLYSLMEFSDTYNKIIETPQDEINLFLGDLAKYYLGYKTKYLYSDKAKHLVSEGIKRLKEIIK